MPRGNKRKYFQARPDQQGKKLKRECLSAGMTGFLLTCSNKNEQRCVREAYDLLNEYYTTTETDAVDVQQPAEISHPEKEKSKDETVPDPARESSSGDDLEKAMEDELQMYRSNSMLEEKKSRFKAVDCGCNNVVFISSAVSDPVAFCHKILSDIHANGKGRARYLQRILPCVATCKTDTDSITNAAEKALAPFFSEDRNPTFLILYKTRNTASSLPREMIIETFGKVIKEINPQCRANLTDPDYAISVDIVKTICCISVMKDFAKLRKYNVHVEEESEPNGNRVQQESSKARSAKEEPKHILSEMDAIREELAGNAQAVTAKIET